MKKAYIIIAIIVSVIVIGVFVTRRAKQQTAVTKPPQLAAEPPSIVFVPNAPTNVRFSLSPGVKLTTPETLPIYTTSFVSPEQQVQTFATAVGLSAPTIDQTPEGTTNMFWNSQDASLTYSQHGSIATMGYHNGAGLNSGTASDKETRIKEFLLPLLGQQVVSKLSLLSQKELSSIEGSHDNGVPLTMFSYAYATEGLPIILANFDPASVVITIGPANEIHGAAITFPPQTFSLSDTKPLLQIQGVLTSLNANRGLLISSYDAIDDHYGSEPIFSSVEIHTITPVYFYEESSSLLFPAIIATGVGTSEEKKQDVQYFLRITN